MHRSKPTVPTTVAETASDWSSLIPSGPANLHERTAAGELVAISTIDSLDVVQNAVHQLAADTPLQPAQKVAPNGRAAEHTIYTLAASVWENSPIEQFPDLLSKLLSIELSCDIDLYTARRNKPVRIASSRKTAGQIRTEEKIEEKIVLEAAAVNRCLGWQVASKTSVPSAIAEELSRLRGGLGNAAIPVRFESADQSIVFLLSDLPEHDADQFPKAVELLQQQASKIAIYLFAWQECRHSQAWRNRLLWFKKLKTPKVALLACGGLLAAFLVPVPYMPSRDCTLEPLSRHHVTSPTDGILNETFVRPGETVTAGQLLAKLDDKQLQRDLAIANADHETASKRREVALATRTGGDLRIAQLEQQQAELRIQSIKAKLAKTEIRSPVDGLIIQGDWISNLGSPVELGEGLFEVCEPDQYLAKVELSSDDLDNITNGCTVVLCTGSIFERVHGTISRIEPKAQIVDDKCIFYAEVDLENTSSSLRPGLKIRARLEPAWKSLGWQMFHRPYRWFANLWIW